MERRWITLTLLLLCAFSGGSGFAWNPDSIDSRILSMFYELWKDAAYGKDPGRSERAAWILEEGSSEYAFLRWPSSRERNKEYWYGPRPSKAVAQVHIHTIVADPKPARKDIELCKKIRVPIYVVSGKGIWVVKPDGNVLQLHDSDWYREVKKD